MEVKTFHEGLILSQKGRNLQGEDQDSHCRVKNPGKRFLVGVGLQLVPKVSFRSFWKPCGDFSLVVFNDHIPEKLTVAIE